MTPLARAVAYLKRARYSVETELAKSGLTAQQRKDLASIIAVLESQLPALNTAKRSTLATLAEVKS